jgi:hypothetical protein
MDILEQPRQQFGKYPKAVLFSGLPWACYTGIGGFRAYLGGFRGFCGGSYLHHPPASSFWY